MHIDCLEILERIASNGTPPSEGCSLFGVGYEDAFERLRKTYLGRYFRSGRSAEKFVVGPFGSGKTHFIRQLMEVARGMGCVTAEVQLSKNLDFTQSIVVYREVAREIHPADGTRRGIEALLNACITKVRAREAVEGVDALELWIAELNEVDFESDAFADVVRAALIAHLRGDQAAYATACRWLRGEVDDREVAKQLGRSIVSKSELNLHAHRSLLSLFQLVRAAGFPGTVLCFDEAEQGLSTDRKKKDRILSMLRSELDALADLRNGSALVVYALTPDLVSEMMDYPALQQRVADPNGMGFFDGENLAPRIDLTRRRKEPLQELEAIATSLVDLVYRDEQYRPDLPHETALSQAMQIAQSVFEGESTVRGRRDVAKNAAAYLYRLIEDEDAPPEILAEPEV